MRFKEFTPTKNGDKRIKTRFLWFPKTLSAEENKKNQTRWLEKASWVEEYYKGFWFGFYWVENE